MKYFLGLMFILLLSAPGAAIAQEDPEPEAVDLLLYSEIPQSRGEDGAFVLGEEDAPVTIMEFSDFLCGHCQNYEETVHAFIEEYVVTGQAKFEYRFFPIIDPNYSVLLANIAECSDRKQLFWPTHNLLFDLARERQIGEDIVEVVAAALEIDLEPFQVCVETASQVEYDRVLGEELGVTGTPAVRVRVGDGEPGVLIFDDVPVNGGGPSLEMLAEFVTADEPESYITYDFTAPIPDVLNDALLADTSILTEDEDCVAPCWRGITPGETSWEDALVLLSADETLANLDMQSGDGGNAAIWGQLDGDLCCQMFSDPMGAVVDLIVLQTAPEVTLEEVIEIHGEPGFLIGDLVSTQQAVLTLFYEDPAVLIYVFVEGVTGEISESSPIVGYVYLDPEIIQSLLTGNPNLIEWTGYAAYSEYFGG